MTAAKRLQPLSVDDYLAGELVSTIKHEYLGGAAHAMAGASNRHNIIGLNVAACLHARLRGSRCQPCNSDTKIHVRLQNQSRFYYPDASVTCQPNPEEDSYQDEPVVIFEVLSPATRRIDVGEKKDAYLSIPSLCVYALVEQDAPQIVLHRRTPHAFVREVYDGLDSVVPLPEIGVELPLVEIYERVDFAPEPADEDEV